MSHLSIVVTSCSIKTVKEFSKDLVSGLRFRDEVFVLIHNVSPSDVVNANEPVSILVHGFESALNHGQFTRAQLVSESSNELFVADVAISINIVGREKTLEINFLGEKSSSYDLG